MNKASNQVRKLWIARRQEALDPSCRGSSGIRIKQSPKARKCSSHPRSPQSQSKIDHLNHKYHRRRMPLKWSWAVGRVVAGKHHQAISALSRATLEWRTTMSSRQWMLRLLKKWVVMRPWPTLLHNNRLKTSQIRTLMWSRTRKSKERRSTGSSNSKLWSNSSRVVRCNKSRMRTLYHQYLKVRAREARVKRVTTISG